MEIHVTATTPAPIEDVWAILTDSAGWADWSDFTDSARIQEGAESPDGVGSVREAWTAGLLRAREEVTVFDEKAKTYEYTIVSGVPIREYVGRVELTKDTGGTQIHWTATGRPLLSIPGADLVNGLVFRTVLTRLSKALAAEAGRRVTQA